MIVKINKKIMTTEEYNKLIKHGIENVLCERNKKQNSSGRRMRVICNKQAKFQQEDGLPLCNNHFKKWFKKKYGVTYSEFINS